MTGPAHEIKYWPETARKPLLQAAFLSDERGLAAWQAWKSQTNMDDYPGFGSFRLLPALYRNLKSMGVDDPLMQRLKGIVRKSWYQNQRFLRSIAGPLEALHEADLELMLLHNPAMALRQPDYALDAETTLSLLVRPEQAAVAIARLQALGWRSVGWLPKARIESYLATGFMHTFTDQAANRKLRLHWHFLSQAGTIQADEAFWAGAVQEQVGTIPVYLPNPADHILHICAQKTSLSEPSLFLRAVDVMLVVDSAQEGVDWERLLHQAAQQHLLLPVKCVLGYLQNITAPLPPPVWQRLQKASVSNFERVEHLLIGGNKPAAWRQAWLVWFNYLRRSRHRPWLPTLTAFPRHLQYLWRLGSLREVIKRVLRQTVSTTRSRLRQSS